MTDAAATHRTARRRRGHPGVPGPAAGRAAEAGPPGRRRRAHRVPGPGRDRLLDDARPKAADEHEGDQRRSAIVPLVPDRASRSGCSSGSGSVFFLCVQYVTGGRWGILLRRPLEANCQDAVHCSACRCSSWSRITMFMGENSIYWWARPRRQHRAHPDGRPEPRGRRTTTRSAFNNVRPDVNVDEDEEDGRVAHTRRSPSPAGSSTSASSGCWSCWMWSNANTAEYDSDLGRRVGGPRPAKVRRRRSACSSSPSP